MNRFNLQQALSVLHEYNIDTDTDTDDELGSSDENVVLHMFDANDIPSTMLSVMEESSDVYEIDLNVDMGGSNIVKSTRLNETQESVNLTVPQNTKVAKDVTVDMDAFNDANDIPSTMLSVMEESSDAYEMDIHVDMGGSNIVKSTRLNETQEFVNLVVPQNTKVTKDVTVTVDMDAINDAIIESTVLGDTEQFINLTRPEIINIVEDVSADTDVNNNAIETNIVGVIEELNNINEADNANNVEIFEFVPEPNLDPHIETDRSRKKVKDKTKWQKEIRKRKRQSGAEYINDSGKRVAKKEIKLKKDCQGHCRYKCGRIFTKADVENNHRDFWSSNDNRKLIFYAKTTERQNNKHKKKDSRRKYIYMYFLYKDNERVRVCKEFYLGVLQIDDSRVRNYYEKMERGDGKQYQDLRGRSTKRRTSENDVHLIKSHIESFPRIPSHYCRASTKKDYLEPGLSLAMMYDMYKDECESKGVMPLKVCMYRSIFNKEYNISFSKPKKDRCDICEKSMKGVDNQGLDQESERAFQNHIADKESTKTERDNDRQQTDKATICFDLENVISLPRADVKNFFYKRKLNTYNLTAHCSVDKTAYNAIWTEAEAGRGANEIASSLVCILRNIRQSHPNIKSFTLWSDACVPQNKNSVMSYALKRFMLECDVHEITQKFCCPGHSVIQEVDNIHSSIEKSLKVKEVYSPISLIRVLKAVRRKAPFKIIQMQKRHFFDYQNAISGLKFTNIPYTKVKCLVYYKQHQLDIDFKLSFSEPVLRKVSVYGKQSTRYSEPLKVLPIPTKLRKNPILSLEKRKDITSMLDYMSVIDRQYYTALKLCVPEESEERIGPQKKKVKSKK